MEELEREKKEQIEEKRKTVGKAGERNEMEDEWEREGEEMSWEDGSR